jgi:hypothetical protein
VGTEPVLPRNCRSARRMEGRESGLRHGRRGGPALRGVAADRFDGLECGDKGVPAVAKAMAGTAGGEGHTGAVPVCRSST